MDRVDQQLIALVQDDAQISHEKLGKVVGLSVSAVGERLKKLQKRGVILGWRAEICPQKAGFSVLAFLYVLLSERSDEQEFLKGVEKIPEVLECHHITGDWSYLLKIRCKDVQHLEAVLGEKVKKLSSVVRTHTMIALSSPLERSTLPIED